MNSPAAITAVYTEWKMVKTRSALVLCFEVPLEQQAIVQAVLGTPLQGESTHVAIARLTTEAAKRAITSVPAQIEPPGRSGSLAQQAGILCGEVAFRRWLAETGNYEGIAVLDLDMAAGELRERCGVLSRRELDTQETAGKRFRDLRADYKLWLHDATPQEETVG